MLDFNGVALVQNYLLRTGRETWAKEFREAMKDNDDAALDRIMANYGEEVVSALGSEVDSSSTMWEVIFLQNIFMLHSMGKDALNTPDTQQHNLFRFYMLIVVGKEFVRQSVYWTCLSHRDS
eukprot:Gb_11835 [translate_table: standard]